MALLTKQVQRGFVIGHDPCSDWDRLPNLLRVEVIGVASWGASLELKSWPATAVLPSAVEIRKVLLDPSERRAELGSSYPGTVAFRSTAVGPGVALVVKQGGRRPQIDDGYWLAIADLLRLSLLP